jgi:2,3-bisphosphoglycerate-dependent phosphoglycerate mutase
VPPTYHQRSFALPPGATEVILVRHGASAPAVPGEPFPLLDGRGDPPLAAEGEAQALAVADRLAGEGLAGIYVTPLRRTAQTAAPLAERTGLEPEVVADLCEVSLGEWEGGEFRIRMAERDPVALQAVAEERWDAIPGGRGRGGARRRGRRGRARRRDRRGVPAGDRQPPVRVRARRQRLADPARRDPRRPVAAALVQ